MESHQSGQSGEMEPIIFKDVIHCYAQTDIRGSSEARNKDIQADQIEQLTLAKDIMKWAGKAANWPLFPEIAYRLDRRIADLGAGLTSNDETAVKYFLKADVEPVFEEVMGLGPRITRAIEKYRNALDPSLGVVYRMRRQFEESVSMLNERLSACLDKEEALAQALFPHYFEKHQTDGIDYIIYNRGFHVSAEKNYTLSHPKPGAMAIDPGLQDGSGKRTSQAHAQSAFE